MELHVSLTALCPGNEGMIHWSNCYELRQSLIGQIPSEICSLSDSDLDSVEESIEAALSCVSLLVVRLHCFARGPRPVKTRSNPFQLD